MHGRVFRSLVSCVISDVRIERKCKFSTSTLSRYQRRSFGHMTQKCRTDMARAFTPSQRNASAAARQAT